MTCCVIRLVAQMEVMEALPSPILGISCTAVIAPNWDCLSFGGRMPTQIGGHIRTSCTRVKINQSLLTLPASRLRCATCRKHEVASSVQLAG